MRLEDLTNRIVSASASVIAVAALVTALYQAKLSRDQARAAVWPYLIQGNSSNGGYSRIVQNVGIGPAIVKAFEVRVDGKPMPNWAEAASAMGVKLTWNGRRTTAFGPGLVVPMGAVIALLELPDSTDERVFRSRLDHLETWTCYCSLYDECWSSSSGNYEPERVRACVDNPAHRFHD